MVNDYNKAKKIIEENKDLADDFGGATDVIIRKAQVELNLRFPEDYKRFFFIVFWCFDVWFN